MSYFICTNYLSSTEKSQVSLGLPRCARRLGLNDEQIDTLCSLLHIFVKDELSGMVCMTTVSLLTLNYYMIFVI